MTPLQSLPNELLVKIAGFLDDVADLNSLSAASRKLHYISNPRLYALAAKEFPHLLTWACEVGSLGVVKKLLVAGSSPNLPAFMPSSQDLNDFQDTSDHPLNVLNNVYGHNLWKRQSNPDQILARDRVAVYDPECHPTVQQYISGTESYWFPLHAAVKSGSDEIVKLLVNSGSYLDLPSRELCSCRTNGLGFGQSGYWTPLHAALCSDDEAMTNLLLTLGASPHIELLTVQSNALHWAARAGHISTMRLLLEDYHTPVDVRDTDGATPLMWALGTKSSVQTMDFLVQHGANLEARLTNTNQRFGELTPITQAAAHAWFSEVAYLVDAGANIGPTPPERFSTLEYCLFGLGMAINREERVWHEYFLSHGKLHQDHLFRHQEFKYNIGLLATRPTPGAFPYGKIPTNLSTLIKRLVQLGAGAQDSALIRACAGHSLELVQYLLANGYQVNQEIVGGLFPLLAAVSGKNLEKAESPQDTIDYLLKHGANPNQTNSFEEFALTQVCFYPERSPKQLEVVKLLLAYGADPNIRTPVPFHIYTDIVYISPFQAAFCRWKEDICRYLMEQGAQISHERCDLRNMLRWHKGRSIFTGKLQSHRDHHKCWFDDTKSVKGLPLDRQPHNPREYLAEGHADCPCCTPLSYLLEIDHDGWLFRDPESLWLAASTWWFPMVKIFLDCGAADASWEPDYDKGRTVLIQYLIWRSHHYLPINYLQRLVDIGVDVNANFRERGSALTCLLEMIETYAEEDRQSRFFDFLQVLLDNGSVTSATDIALFNSYAMYAETKDLEIVRELYKRFYVEGSRIISRETS
ncbi:ankyrin [Annulohypoxylon truncatum]|uniref:ankyrin n=1 Tax=Annulohypoxylon truncatum TaxID=327061 RepID=UPI0020089D80|nr:ankyrin [Annulohypoxylon truncatum]KAI1207038.1 ankyrin [Annulohypoxylon truncatum]